jgi:hypothetical protein
VTTQRIAELRLLVTEAYWYPYDRCAVLAECLDEIERLEAVNAVQGGEWCAQNRAEGRGGCGACAWCCQQLRDELERLQAQIEKDAGARALWDAHFGEPYVNPGFVIESTPHESGWIVSDAPGYGSLLTDGVTATRCRDITRYSAYLRGNCIGTFDTEEEAHKALDIEEAKERR